jgi:hypothetical protein
LKEWQCVDVHNHNDIGNKIMEMEMNGWKLHTYTCGARTLSSNDVHYLLFQRGK